MSVLLIGSSLVTTLLIPPKAFRAGGQASGRALAYLAHELLGEVFGTDLRPQHDLDPVVCGRVRDGGASEPRAALSAPLRHGAGVDQGDTAAGLLVRGIMFLITVLFNANVEAQGGAYATGVLVLMTSAAFAVTLHAFGAIASTAFRFGAITRRVRLHDRREHVRAP